LAEKHLLDAGFSNVRNLNVSQKNYPFGDLYAERDGVKYVISVKARNEHQADGKLNASYKIGPKARVAAARIRAREGFVPAWIAISLRAKEQTYSCYFGLLDELKGKHGIKMTPEARRSYVCFGESVQYTDDVSHLFNEARRRSTSPRI
jgi:hypothetical protein